jgi:hypothetical protein
MQRHPLHRLAAVPPRVSRPPLRDANASVTALAPAMRNANVVCRTVQNANALLPPCASSPLSCRPSSQRFLRDANASASSRMPWEHPPAHEFKRAPPGR